MTQPTIEFWFDFGSAYAYFASFEIEDLAAKHARTVTWRPYMLGTAFNVTGARGLSSTPLKRDYALNDWRRISRLTGIPFDLPSFHPAVAVPAMRGFYHLEQTEPQEAVPFAKAVFAAYFQDGIDIGDAAAVIALAGRLGLDAAAFAEAIQRPELKALCKARSEEAVGRARSARPG